MNDSIIDKNQTRKSETLKYIPYESGKWVIPLAKDSGNYMPSLTDWDSSTLNSRGKLTDEKFGGVVVISCDELNPERSENVLSLLCPDDLGFIRECVKNHGISYPIGTPDKDKG